MKNLKQPQDNNNDPFRTSLMENTAAAKVSDYIWNKIMFYVLDCKMVVSGLLMHFLEGSNATLRGSLEIFYH